MSLYTYDKTTILGKVGKNAEMRYMPNGDAVTKFSIAVDRSYKKDGETIKRTIWYSVQVFGKFAEVCKDIKKGDLILAEGNLDADWTTGSPRTWNKQDGGVGTSFELTAQTIKFLTKREASQASEPAPEEDNPF